MPPDQCPTLAENPSKDGQDKTPTQLFFEQKNKAEQQRRAAPGAILVGTGDNFAPEIEARNFMPHPSAQIPGYAPGNYVPVGKELYVWFPKAIAGSTGVKVDGTKIQPDRWVSDAVADKIPPLRDLLKEGKGFIPTDNVGCFLIAAGYSAVVPGKHDFYFGPERLRELARLLSSKPKADGDTVQMLGANIVIETSFKKDHKPLPDSDNPPNFVPRWPKDITGLNLSDGGKVYPWFPRVEVKLKGLSSQTLLQVLKPSGLATPAGISGLLSNVALDGLSTDPTYQRELQEVRNETNWLAPKHVYLCPAQKKNGKYWDPRLEDAPPLVET